mgnify:CR=1 FL=1
MKKKKKSKSRSEYYNTIDLDHDPRTPKIKSCTKSFLHYVVNKIKRCPNLLSITLTESNSKGYHIILRCAVKCDICRLVFDDPERYIRDINRKHIYQNVLFQRKTIIPKCAISENWKTLRPSNP